MLPLSMAAPGETQAIFKITGRDEVRRHLAELGLVVGEEVTVMNSLGAVSYTHLDVYKRQVEYCDDREQDCQEILVPLAFAEAALHHCCTSFFLV